MHVEKENDLMRPQHPWARTDRYEDPPKRVWKYLSRQFASRSALTR